MLHIDEDDDMMGPQADLDDADPDMEDFGGSDDDEDLGLDLGADSEEE